MERRNWKSSTPAPPTQSVSHQAEICGADVLDWIRPGVWEDAGPEPSLELWLREIVIIISRELGRGSVTNFYSLQIIQSDGSLELVYIRHSSHSQEYQKYQTLQI